MFKRLHYQLTGLCALITMAILSVFSILWLTISERTLRDNFNLSFLHHFQSLCGSLEQQSILTYAFLLRMEQTNDCMIFLWDGGRPLAFNRTESHAPYADMAQEFYENYLSDSLSDAESGDSDTARILLLKNQNVGVDHIHMGALSAMDQSIAQQRGEGPVLVMLSSTASLRDRVVRQRIYFALLSLGACSALTVFAWIFTGRMLGPIEENQRSQLEFISGASHELRTPLAVILSSVEAKPPCYEETIRSESLRMGRLVEELLTLTRLYHSGSKEDTNLLRLEPLEPDTLLISFYEQMDIHVRSLGKRLRLELPDRTFPKIRADRDKVFQLFEILVQNALSYTGEDGVITLSLTADSRGDRICFAIADNGIGIPDGEKDKIFERFYRADSAHSSGEHFGLGLSIAMEIVRLHRGTLRVTDTPGGGSTFLCRFPKA